MTDNKSNRAGAWRRRFGLGAIGAIAVAAGFFGVTKMIGGEIEAAGTANAADTPPAGPPPAPVYVAEAVETMIAPLAEAPGATVSVSDSGVAAETTGKVVWVAEIGDEIAAGGAIARLDPADAELALADAKAELRRLQAREAYLARLVNRYEALGEDTGESEAAMDEVRANHGEAAGALERGRVAARQAALALERTTIRAPFAGRVAAREVEVGEFATVGAPVVRLVDVSRLEVTARASADVLSAVAAGDRVNVSYKNETTLGGVRAIVPVGDEVTRMLEVRITLEGSDWPIGAPVRVNLPAAAPMRSVEVHKDALVLRADGAAVFKVGEDGAAIRTPVGIGAAHGDLIQIEGDVHAGDRIVVRGAERLRNGQSVDVRSPPAS